MCGIAGLVHKSGQQISGDQLWDMTNALVHRGPDDGQIYLNDDGRVGLGHRRLSIIDLANGKQPMANGDETIWIVFNGEIYNYRELRRELTRDGFQFRTSSDTEVIIALYERDGVEAFVRLEGIFALAIYDKRQNRMVVARDHFGVKPLYYYLDAQRFVFASELKAIFACPAVAKELDLDALNTYLTFRYSPSPQTLFQGVKKLAPGHYLELDLASGAEKLASYWHYEAETDNRISEADAIAEYQRLLERAVEKQMVSDVPIGLLLSGGMDSAVLGYLMQQATDERIKTFTIGFSGNGHYNEREDARRTAEYIGSEHFELEISQQEYLDFFFKSYYYTEEPIGEPTIPSLYYIAQLAGSHLKVVMAGQGADEPMAGYNRYIGEYYINKYASILRMLPLKTLTSLIPRNVKIKRAAFASQFDNELQRFLGIYTIFTPDEKVALLRPEILTQFEEQNETLVRRLHDQTGGLTDSLSRLTYIDTRLSLSDSLLLFNDKMTMANSLEMRVPFLDIELVKFLESLPASMKLRGRTGKYIHKQAVKKWLPDEIIYRPKRGFSTPIDLWLRSDWAKTAKALLTADDSACSQYFNSEHIAQLIDKHRSGRENYMRRIFSLLSFELWHRCFFDDEEIEWAKVA